VTALSAVLGWGASVVALGIALVLIIVLGYRSLSGRALVLLKRSWLALLNAGLVVGFWVSASAGDSPHTIRSSADSDSQRVWMALLKGFEGDVRYVGSDDEYAYFQIGTLFLFRSYHKLPLCAVQLPETFPLQSARAYVVRFHIEADNTIRMTGGTCKNYEGHPLGELDKE
jgi:hypothetical protein